MQVDVDVNMRKVMFMMQSYHQNVGQSYKIKTNKSSENMNKFKYVGRTATNQNSITGD
jgi:hypothetical protein